MKLALVLAGLVLLTPGADAAQAPRPRAVAQTASPADKLGEAYAQYMLAHRLESDNDVTGAIAAYNRAMELDPDAADIPAELASFYLRQNRLQDARIAGDQALMLDPDNREANRVIGTIYAAMMDAVRDSAGRTPLDAQDNLTKAITHLERSLPDANGGEPNPNVVAMLARLYVASKRFDKAIPLLTGLAEREPGWQEGTSLLVDAYIGAGRIADAIPWLEMQSMDDPRLLPMLADLYERQLRWQDAANAYEQALKRPSRVTDLRTRYGSALMNVGGRKNVQKARDALTEAIASRATDARAMYLLSQAQRRLGDASSAASTARQLITLQNGKGPWGYHALAEALEEQRDYQAVIDTLTPAVATFRSQPGGGMAELAILLPHIGFAQQELGQYDRAIVAFDEAYKISPIDPTIAGSRIEAYTAARQFKKAADLAREARSLGMQEVQFARLEAHALRRDGRTGEAAALLEGIRQQHADDPNAYIGLAQVYAESGRGADAITVLQDARAKFPASVFVLFELGAQFEKQQRFADAEAAFKAVLSNEPDNAAALNYLGYMLADRGERLDESVGYLTRAVQMEPNNGSFIDSLGWAYFKSDRLDLAESNLRTAAAQLTSNSVVQDHYGDVLAKLGRLDEAVTAWTRSLAGDGDAIDRAAIDRKIRAAKQQLNRR